MHLFEGIIRIQDLIFLNFNFFKAQNQKSRIKKSYMNILEKTKLMAQGLALQPTPQTVTLSVKDSNKTPATPDLDKEVGDIEKESDLKLEKEATVYFPKSM